MFKDKKKASQLTGLFYFGKNIDALTNSTILDS